MARTIRAKNTSEEKAASAVEFKAIKEIISLNSLPIIEMAGRSEFPATSPRHFHRLHLHDRRQQQAAADGS